jgi:uncharacterized tellurite resistance protein B-like protein
MLRNIADYFSQTMINPSKEQRRFDPEVVAACALILEMAHADSAFTNDERESIISIFENEFDIPHAEIAELLTLAEAERAESLDLWQFTNLVNEYYDRDQKIRLMEILWQIILADGKIDRHEEYLARKLHALLNLEHRDMIDAKLRAKEKFLTKS